MSQSFQNIFNDMKIGNYDRIILYNIFWFQKLKLQILQNYNTKNTKPIQSFYYLLCIGL